MGKNNFIVYAVIVIIILLLVINPFKKEEVQTGITRTCYDINKVQIDCNPKVPEKNYVGDFFQEIKYKISNLIPKNEISSVTSNSTSGGFFKNIFGSMLSLMGSVGNFAIVSYSSQCTLAACPAGYTDVGSTCDDVTKVCTRICQQVIAGTCGSYGGYSDVKSSLAGGSFSSWHSTNSYSMLSTQCYQFKAKSIMTIDGDVTSGSYTQYARIDGPCSSSSSSTYSITSMPQSTTKTSSVCTIGQGSGTITASGKMVVVNVFQYTSSLFMELETILQMSTATYTAGYTNNAPQTCSYSSSCTESWICGAWSTCSSGTQTRTCTDSNSCGTMVTKPPLSQSCGTSSGGLCYQESANVATACGGKSTGAYTSSNNFGASSGTGSAVYDGNWGTGASRDTSGTSYLTSIYYKPLNAQSTSLWQIKYGTSTSTAKNLTIPSDCWGTFTDRIQLKLESLNGGSYGNSNAYCWNGAWKLLDTSTADNVLYEEGMEWNILSPTAYENYTINVLNDGQVPFNDIKIVSTSPSNFLSYYTNTPLSLGIGSSGTINMKTLIDTNLYPGNFTVYLSGNNTYTNQINNFQASIMI